MTKTTGTRKAAPKPPSAAAKSNGAASKSAPASAVKAKPVAARKAAVAKPKAPAVKTKAAKPAKLPAKAGKTVAKVKPLAVLKEKVKKPKLVRDSFTMPEAEYQVLGDVKKACLKAGMAVKKSELLRVGVALIKAMDVAKLKDVLATLAPLKAGRPPNEK